MKKKNFKQVLAIAGTTAASIIFSIIVSKMKSNDTEVDEYINDDSADNEYTDDDKPQKKPYKGYIPWGCAHCGGPYPLCWDGCFDD